MAADVARGAMPMRSTRSRLHKHFEAAVDETFAVKRHRVLVRLQAGVRHNLVTHIARRPENPRENDRLVVLALDRHGKGRKFALGHIVLPAFDDFQCAVFLKDNGSGFGVYFIGFAISRRNGCNKSIYVVHGVLSFFWGRLNSIFRYRLRCSRHSTAISGPFFALARTKAPWITAWV